MFYYMLWKVYNLVFNFFINFKNILIMLLFLIKNRVNYRNCIKEQREKEGEEKIMNVCCLIRK